MPRSQNREEKFAYQYQVHAEMFMGEQSPVRIILLVFFPGKSYGLEGPKNIDKCPPAGTGRKIQFPSKIAMIRISSRSNKTRFESQTASKIASKYLRCRQGEQHHHIFLSKCAQRQTRPQSNKTGWLGREQRGGKERLGTGGIYNAIYLVHWWVALQLPCRPIQCHKKWR